MFFTLEAVKAKHGDSLLVHLGTQGDRRLLIIDGGPSGVYEDFLKPRLQKLSGGKAGLPVRMLMVSHIDDDHINGVLDMTAELEQQRQDQEELSYDIRTLWHNSFNDIMGDEADEVLKSFQDEVGPVDTASLEGEVEFTGPISKGTALVLASVPQGRTLRNRCEALGLSVNKPFRGLVLSLDKGEAIDPPLAPQVETIVVGPSIKRVKEFREEWDKILKEKDLAQDPDEVATAAYEDKSPFNLASIVVLMRCQGKSMLLTGDARGDDILAGLSRNKLLDGEGRLHVDILKLPHHGSDRNVETNFFRSITADHYVVSGDGRHHNPEIATFEMLFSARRDDDRPFTIHMTYAPDDLKINSKKAFPVKKLKEVFRREKEAGRDFTLVHPAGEKSLKVNLLDAIP
ncbi:MAG TPA: hypothetical protein VLV83_04305 [Acidobacteriota bacterium]|nr:hypothetical protein [Acidobacteriota bacterium]